MHAQILVLGATGKTGRRVVRQLTERGVAVRAAGRPGFDWGDPATYPAALDGVGGVYVVVPPGRDTDPVAEVAAFLDHARGRRIVLLSALGVDAAPVEPPLRRVERLVEPLGATILRPNWFAENFSENIYRPDIVERDEIVAPAGTGRVSFVSVEDIAAVAVRALTEPGHEGRTYALTGPEALSFGDVAAVLSTVTGRTIRHVDPPEDRAAAHLVERGLPVPYARQMLGVYAGIRAGAFEMVTGDAATLTGRAPIPFDRYARDAAQAWRPAS